MFIKKEDCIYETIKNMKNGDGEFQLQHIASKENLFNHGRLFAKGTLPPGSSVGLHEHVADVEICYFLEGEGLLIDDNKTYQVKTGDVNIVYGGKSHEIINNGNKDLVYIVLVLYN